MKVILKTRVPNLGLECDIITVKDGYARNFLLPKKLADKATPALIKKAEKVIEERTKKLEEVIKNAKEIAEKLSNVGLIFKTKAKEDKLYGSISEKDIADEITKQEKIEVTKEMVNLKAPIKKVGEYKVKLTLTEGVTTEIGVKVEAE